jgi:hypothetical protein
MMSSVNLGNLNYRIGFPGNQRKTRYPLQFLAVPSYFRT